MTKYYLIVILLFSGNSLFSQTPCENGSAGTYPCNQIDFYARLTNTELSGGANVALNDIWGWTDPETNKEYALVGLTNGTVFVDISAPANPQIIGRLPSHTGNSSPWRDIKVYANHAFIVADQNSGHGMQVFDLTRLRDVTNAPETFTNDAHYNGVGSAHNVVINEESGFAYIVGARGAGNGCGAGGLHIVDINNPKNPVYAGCFDADGYTHDAQCVIYQGPDTNYRGKEVCFNANENTITIANVDDKNNTSLIGKEGYPESEYSHQGWLTEDHQYFISNDELDEQRQGINTRTLIWDVRDLENPKLLNQYFSERRAIDHNLYIHQNKIYQSNYENGLIILDAQNLGEGKTRELGFFDTYTQGNSANFNGSWSNYPFFDSGVVIVSDINNGLFILSPNIENSIVEHPGRSHICKVNQLLDVEVDPNKTVAEYQWQSLNGSEIINLSNSEEYEGVSTASLLIKESINPEAGKTYRCKITFTDGKIAFSFPSSTISETLEVAFSIEQLDEYTFEFINESKHADTYSWNFGDGSPISFEENPIHNFPENGFYQIKLTAENNCDSKELISSVSINFDGAKPCLNGEVNGYPCNQIDLYARLTNAELSGTFNTSLNDIWGWTDPETSKEYALVGLTNGTVFVDISSPSTPVVIGRLPSHTGVSSTWRDIKVFDNHAFIVADNNGGHGMQVFDLTRLRSVADAPETFTNDAHYDGISSAHNIVINEATGFAYIVGARNASNGCGVGGLHIVDINDPKNPIYAGCFDSDGYTHDAQCVIYEGPDAKYQGKEICFNANENTVTIADVTDKTGTTLIAKQGYPMSAYAHQGWLTEDHQYFISNDELDEQREGINTRTLIWDVRDLENPKLLTQYYSERAAIDHNLYVKENKIYQSNYENGLIILDAAKIADGNLRELAYFDTYTASNNTDFNGSWSNYPFFETGIVIISDRNNGLFIVSPAIEEIITQHPLLDVAAGTELLEVQVDPVYTVSEYQWQTLNELVPQNLENDAQYEGVTTDRLVLRNDISSYEDQVFRCKITLIDGKIAYTYFSSSPSDLMILSNQKTWEPKVNVYPNPVADKLFIHLADCPEQLNRIEVYNLQGKKMYEETVAAEQQTVEIATNSWPANIYLMRLSYGNGFTSQVKVLKK